MFLHQATTVTFVLFEGVKTPHHTVDVSCGDFPMRIECIPTTGGYRKMHVMRQSALQC